jgi:hypothetical protein
MSKEKMSMKSVRIATALAALLMTFAVAASSASADFGIEPGSFDSNSIDPNGHAMLQAGAHPFASTTGFDLNTEIYSGPGEENGLPVPQGGHLRNVKVEVPAGLVGNPLATERCKLTEFAKGIVSPGPFKPCPDSTQVGIAEIDLNLFGSHSTMKGAIYNLTPGGGQPALFGFWALIIPVYINPTIRSNGDYGLNVNVLNIDESTAISGTRLTFWGVPASATHDMERGNPLFGQCADQTAKPCKSGEPEIPFLTNPFDCAHGPFQVNMSVESWEGASDGDSMLTHDDEGNPRGVERCDRVPFEPAIDAKQTTNDAETPTGLDFELKAPSAGLLNADGIADSPIKKAVVRLPDGVSLNPSAGEGLGVCTPADYAREDVDIVAGSGCPNSSKLGSVDIETPLLEEHLTGSVYLAASDNPKTTEHGAENPFDSLISIYIVARSAERGVVIKAAGKVEPDEKTGQIVTTFDNLPQLPFDNLKIHFREGQRSPLVSPPSCGTYTTVAEMTPWANQSQVRTVKDQFVVQHGVGGSPCASGAPPFDPNIQAGTLNNNAGAFSPFYLRMFRNDNEQEITNFSADLPTGMVAKLAGIPKCSDAALAKAAANTGLEEKENPSCPAASQVGHATVGYGVGTVLNYSPGKVYLAGPYHGTPVSIATVTSALIGPFDVGTVIVRSAFRVDGETGQVHVDSKGSDPIPHILKGVLLHLRDIRLYMDRPDFTLNPTNCDRMTVQALITGSGGDFVSSADDAALPASTPFQAAGCGLLKFKPKLAFKLKGGTHRGDYPALTTTLQARKGDANISKAVVTLPHSEFLAQEHIGTVCTRVQFAAKNCPAASVYGRARAVTPLLDKPLEGPVYLRSSSHPLPDLVADLGGEIQVTLAGRIDSVHGRIRTTFNRVPDVPVTKFTLKMRGGKKGLLVNSRNLCKAPGRAEAKLGAQNGKTRVAHPVMKTGCRKGGRSLR